MNVSCFMTLCFIPLRQGLSLTRKLGLWTTSPREDSHVFALSVSVLRLQAHVQL